MAKKPKKKPQLPGVDLNPNPVQNPSQNPPASAITPPAPATNTKKPEDKGPTFTPTKPPPTPDKGPPSTPTALKKMSQKYWRFKKYLPTITAAAKLYDVDAVQLYAALVSLGSGGDPAFRSNSQALGLAQVSWSKVEKWMNPARYADFVRKWGDRAYDQAEKPNWAINFLAWAMGGSGGNYATLDAWMAGGVRQNTNAKYGRSPYQIIQPKGRSLNDIIQATVPDYQPKPFNPIPDQVDKEQAKQIDAALKRDPYVAGVDGSKPGGGLVLTYDINKAMTKEGAPIHRSDFLSLQNNYSQVFESYTGKSPTFLQIGNFIKNGWSDTALVNLLSKSPSFKTSPIYKRDSLTYRDAAKDLVPAGTKIPDELMRQAITTQMTIGGFQQALRDHGFYEQSNEFQNNYGVLSSSYQHIMGTPDNNAVAVIKRATHLGWTQATFETWLRKTPAYKYSPEYQSKVVGFLDSMGLLIGARAQLAELTVKQMQNVPTQVTEAGKTMTVSPSLDLMPSGKNPTLKANYPFTSTPTPPSTGGAKIAKEDQYKVPTVQKTTKKTTQTKSPQRGSTVRTGPYAKKVLP